MSRLPVSRHNVPLRQQRDTERQAAYMEAVSERLAGDRTSEAGTLRESKGAISAAVDWFQQTDKGD